MNRLAFRALLCGGLLALWVMPAAGALAQRQSGIIGRTFIDAGCPVVTPDIDCSDRPYPTSISVYSEQGRLIRQLTTDEMGRFKILLRPGTYLLVPVSGEFGFPYAAPVEVTVRRRHFTRVIIAYDTGIR